MVKTITVDIHDFNSNVFEANENNPISTSRPNINIPARFVNAGTIYLRLSGQAPCVVCGRQVKLVGFEDAAEIFSTDVQDIEYLAKNREVHRIHNRAGELMICSDSLFECFDNRRTRLLDSHFAMEKIPID